MHNNYYFLRRLSAELEKELGGFTLVSCFSQNKDELILEFNNTERSFFIKASLLPDFQCLSFPVAFHRARKNSIDLFSEIILSPVTGVRQFQDERSFALMLGDAFALVFKMHGRQSNVILFHSDRVHAVFRNNLPNDLSLLLHQLNRPIDWSFEAFKAHLKELESTYVTFGKSIWNHLAQIGFGEKDTQGKWGLVQQVKKQLEDPVYSIIQGQGGPQLTLLPAVQFVAQFDNPIQAVNEFFFLYQSRSGLDQERAALLSSVRGRLKQSRAFMEKSKARLAEVERDQHYQQWGDLIMANMHRIRQGIEEIELEDFHVQGRMVRIKLKKELSPQKNAEALYRKAKNQAIELRTLRETINRKEQELTGLLDQERSILSATNKEGLQPFTDEFSSRAKEKERKVAAPYHEHTYSGFRILVGKNAQANDELTLHHAYKEDLWLHAKDVAGSHVLIKHQAGKPFPKDVIEFAAALAAYYSKRKNESLCPVAVTPAKYVRKRKGDPAGAVVVQREDVLMVTPWKPAPGKTA